MSFDVQDAAAELHEQFPDSTDATEDELADELEQYSEFDVPKSEAMDTVRRKFVDEDEMDDDDGGFEEPVEMPLGELSEDGQPVTVTVEVTGIDENPHEAFAQKGWIGDETARVGFKEFESSDTDIPELEEGQAYRIENGVIDEYQGNISVKLNEYTTVEQIDDDVEVTDDTDTLMATVVNIQRGSGLIERCPEEDCTYTVDDRPCPEHGDVDGEYDLRVKAHADTGTDVTEILLDTELTEDLLDLTVDEAVEKARDEMDFDTIAGDVREEMIGRYYVFTGSDFGRFLVDEFSEMEVDVDAQADELLARAEEVSA